MGLTIGLSLVIWLAVVWLGRPCHPYADLSCGHYTDHFSDMNAARALPAIGVDIWRDPLAAVGRRLTADEKARLPADLEPVGDGVRAVPAWPDDKPFASSFAHLPSLTPPGGLLITAPAAAAYHWTSLSFTDANRMLISLFLVYAHVSLYVFFTVTAGTGLIGFLAGTVVAVETVHLTLLGFSEAALIAPLVLSGWALKRGDGLKGAAWFALASSLHFRALFFLPLGIYAVYLVVARRQSRTWRGGEWSLAAATVLLLASTTAVLLLVAPSFSAIELTSRFHISELGLGAVAMMFAVVVAALAIAFAFARSWGDIAVLLWMSVMLLLVREAFPWNILTLLAWLGLPATRSADATLARDVRLAALLFVAIAVFDHDSFPVPTWIQQVFS